MSLVRWNPVHDTMTLPSELFDMQREINQLFDSFFHKDRGDVASAWKPAVDIVEHDNEFVARVELPGVRKDDVKITMQNNVLTVRGEKRQEQKEKGTNYHRVERSYGSFQRSFTLPGSVKNDTIDAEFVNGILTIHLPKAEEAKAREIEVKVK